MQQLSPNSLLQGGKYRIEKVLGQGGFGITYLGVQVALNRKVAIKEFFMKEYCNRDEETSHVSVPSEGSKELVGKFRAKFVKEAQNIACLNHPHIIRIYDIFEENGTAYYVMEYWDHGSLGDHVKSHGRLPEAEALRYIRQVGEALDYIHQRKMNHLDVKPGNILLDEAHNAVLIDFGLSKRYDAEGNQTSTTPVGISHGYAPLEQYKKGGVGIFSPATDVYSLGATLYKLLTGETPPEANDVMDEGLPAFPASVSATTVSAIEKAMQPAKKNRPQSIGEFLELLGMGEEPIKKEIEDDEDTKPVEDEDTKPMPAPQPQPQPKPTPAPQPEPKVTEVTESKSSSRKTWVISLSVVAVALIWLLWPKGGNDVAPTPVKSSSSGIGKINGHDYVDLGLSVKWATCNVGASSPSDYGSYFAWGETSTKSSYTEENSVTFEKNFGDISGDSRYDAARAHWGGSWRLPTKAECKELHDKCKWTWTTQGGHNGYKVVGPNGNSIFLPAAGSRYGTSLYYVGEGGDCWSSTPAESDTQDAYGLNFYGGIHSVYWNYRGNGRSVRPVSE